MSAGEVLLTRALDDARTAVVVVTDRGDGDLRVDGDPEELADRRRAVTDHPWTWLVQVHGTAVVTVAAPGEGAGTEADAAVTTATGAALAVHTADCAPVALVAASGAIAVAHVGWRGLEAGVLAATVDRLGALGGDAVSGVLGPCIHPGCYAFGAADLDDLAAAVGPSVRGTTTEGGPAVDLPAGVATALAAVGVEDLTIDARCTGCDPSRFSHRARRERGRQALVAWIDP